MVPLVTLSDVTDIMARVSVRLSVTTCIIGEVIAKDSLNVENLTHTFKNSILQTAQNNSGIL